MRPLAALRGWNVPTSTLLLCLFVVFDRNYCTFGFWATVCKTVRPMLSDRCLSCLWRWCIVAKRLHGSRCHLVWRLASAQSTLLDRDPAPPTERGQQPPPHSLADVIAAKGSPISEIALLSCCYLTETVFLSSTVGHAGCPKMERLAFMMLQAKWYRYLWKHWRFWSLREVIRGASVVAVYYYVCRPWRCLIVVVRMKTART